MYSLLVVLAIFAFLYSLVAGRLENTRISGPMIFVVFGILLGPLCFGFIKVDPEGKGLRLLADLTLALVLFCDAANVDRKQLRLHSSIPIRMLAIGLPLAILFGMAAGWAVFDQLSIWEIGLLATMLAATDAALGKAVVTNPAVPARLRTGLNVESGLNDGLCVPVLLLFLEFATAEVSAEAPLGLAFHLLLSEIGIGLLCGLGITLIGTLLYEAARKRRWITEEWRGIPVTMLALACFASAQCLHGSGYIAAFTGGWLFGFLVKQRAHHLVIETEGVGETLAMMTWILFGAVVVDQALMAVTPAILLYAALSLTVVRMVPIVISLIGSGEPMSARLFLGWFGPRGLASVVFVVIVSNHPVLNAGIIANTVVWTILLSVFIHGLTTHPLIDKLSKVAETSNRESL